MAHEESGLSPIDIPEVEEPLQALDLTFNNMQQSEMATSSNL